MAINTLILNTDREHAAPSRALSFIVLSYMVHYFREVLNAGLCTCNILTVWYSYFYSSTGFWILPSPLLYTFKSKHKLPANINSLNNVIFKGLFPGGDLRSFLWASGDWQECNVMCALTRKTLISATKEEQIKQRWNTIMTSYRLWWILPFGKFQSLDYFYFLLFFLHVYQNEWQ